MSLTLARASSQYLTVPYNAVLAPTAITLSAWVNPSSVTAQRVAGRVNTASTTYPLWALEVNANNCRLSLANSVTTQSGLLNLTTTTTYGADTLDGGTVPANVWTHIAGTFDGATMTVYVNGAVVGTASRSQALLTATSALAIGAHYNGSAASSFFDGGLDDLRIYGRALAAPEILSLYTTRGSNMNLTGLIANFQFTGAPVGSTLTANATVTDISYNALVATNAAAGPTYGLDIVRRRRPL